MDKRVQIKNFVDIMTKVFSAGNQQTLELSKYLSQHIDQLTVYLYNSKGPKYIELSKSVAISYETEATRVLSILDQTSLYIVDMYDDGDWSYRIIRSDDVENIEEFDDINKWLETISKTKAL